MRCLGGYWVDECYGLDYVFKMIILFFLLIIDYRGIKVEVGILGLGDGNGCNEKWLELRYILK